MAKYSRFEVIATDRMGITVEILHCFLELGINLVSVEVFPEKLCVMTEELSKREKIQVEELLNRLVDVKSVKELRLLQYEKNERSLRAVIDAVDEGVVAVDGQGAITIFNNYCQELFGYEKESVVGQDVRKVLGVDAPIVNLILGGKEYNQVDASVRLDSEKIQYVSTGRIIKDDDNQTMGAVASIKDTQKVLALAELIENETEAAFKEIIGISRAIEKIKKIIQTVARSHSTVMLRGESGTGKELFAHAIHKLSGRAGKYITLNCAALPETLLESELFGYEKGSFTGAVSSGKVGLFSEADGGTIFLDEIGELTPVIQAKLLRVLQEGKVRKIGSLKEESIDVRVIVATNRNLEDMLKEKLFREDLYYRLNVIPIIVPPLSTRREDIPLLVHHFINKLNRRLERNVSGVQKDFMDYLTQHDLPGNVRQLQNLVERAVNLCEGDRLTLKNIGIDTFKSCNDSSFEQSIFDFTDHVTLKECVMNYEKKLVLDILKQERSYRKAAKRLGVSHTTLLNKVKRYSKECNEK